MKRHLGTLVSCLAAATLVGSCLGEPTGLGARVGALAVAPRFASLFANALVDVAAVRLVLSRPNATVATLDTVVAFQTGADSIALTLTVPMDGASLDFVLRIAVTNPQGDTVFRAGPIPVRVSMTRLAFRIVRPDLIYVGTGANAASVRFVNPPLALNFGQTGTLVAEALDGQGVVIPRTPIGFALVNPADTVRATIADPAIGSIVARSLRGSVQVRAVLLTGPSVTHTIIIQPTASTVIAQSGGGQSGAAGLALTQPFVARVRAADGLGVQGVPVNFEVLTGGGTLSRLVDTTDVNGDARAVLTVGTVPGAQSARAVVPSLGGATVSFAATAVAGAATNLVFGVAPSNVSSGAIMVPAVTVRARDQFGNDAASFVGSVTLALLNNPLGAVLGGTLTRTAVAGVATLNDLALSGLGTGITIRATSGALTAATSTAFNVTVGPAASLAFSVQPPATSSGSPFVVAVAARDAGGNTVPTFTSAIAVAIGANPSAGTLSGVTTLNAVAGSASFAGLSIDNVGAGYTLVATQVGLTSATSVPFTVGSPAGVNAWVNATGGNWSTPGNWSLGTVPTATDIVWIRQSGTYTVTLDAPATVGRMLVGGTSGTQTLAISGTSTLTMTDSVLVAANGAVAVSGGGIAGTGAMSVASAFTWSGGSLTGTGARVRVLAGGALAISGTATRNFSNFALEVAGTGTWTGTQTINSGSAATIRVLGGGTLSIQGDPQWLFNQGGAASVFDVQGALTRTTSTGTAVVTGLSVSGTATVTSGVLELQGTGTSSGLLTAATGGTLRFTTGAQTLTAASNVQGAGIVEVSGPGTITSAGSWGVTGTTRLSGGTFTYNGVGATAVLDLAGGVRAGTGALDVTGSMTWSAGDLLGGGSTRVAPGATMTMIGVATRQLNSHTLVNDGTATWSGTFTLNSGTAARIRNGAGATFTWSGDGQYLFNQGGGQSVFENLGIFLRTGTGIAQLGAQLIDTLGTTFDIQAGELRLSNGGRIGGTKTLSGGNLELAAGALSMRTGTVWAGAAGLVRVTGGTLTLDSAAVAVVMPRLDLLGGVLTHEGLLEISTAMNWDAGDITSNVVGLGGTTRIRVGATLAVGGAAARTFNGTHRLHLQGNTTLPFTGAINSGAGAVIENAALFDLQGAGNILNNQGGANSIFRNLAGATLRSSGATTGTISFPVENIGALAVTGDSLRLAGGSSTVFAGTATVTANALHLAGGAFTLTGALTATGAAGNLVVGGSLNLNSNTVTVGGSFSTIGTGTFTGTTASSILNVTGSAAFSGGNSAPTAGLLQVGGSFVQAGATNSFNATGTHRTVFTGTGTQNITFASPTTSRFNRLEVLPITRSVVLQTNAVIGDSLVMLGGAGASNLIGAGTTQRLTANGVVVLTVSTLSPRLAPPVLELATIPIIGAIGVAGRGMTPDTAVYTGGNIGVLPVGVGIRYNSVRVSTTAVMTIPADTIAGDLHLAGNIGFFGASTTFRVGGKLRTTGTGSLAILSADVNLTVVDSTIFGGASTNGLLTAGTLTALGAFVQNGGDPAAFAATLTFLVHLNATALQQVRFTNPGTTTTTSHFADLRIGNSSVAGIQFLSPVFVTNQLLSLPGRLAISRISGTAADSLSINGILADSITFDGVPLRIGGTAALTNLSMFTFQNMNLAVNQFTITRAGGTFAPNAVTFLTTPNVGVYNLVVTSTATAGPFTANFGNSVPTAAATMIGPPRRYLRLGAPTAVIVWNTITLP